MPNQHDDRTQTILSQVLDEHQLTGETRLYREIERSSLTATSTPGVFRLAANPAPSEVVIDVYGPGYVVQAEQVGPGWAFGEIATPNWQETMELRAMRAGPDPSRALANDRVEVEVRVADLLGQGGRIYPVESVSIERVWYFTIPTGQVNVREVP